MMFCIGLGCGIAITCVVAVVLVKLGEDDIGRRMF